MQLVSTRSKSITGNFQQAVLNSIPPGNGLYMPSRLPLMPLSFVQQIEQFSFQDIATQIATKLIGDEIPESELQSLVQKAFNFPIPITNLDLNTKILELYHGPSLAFKDFGSRFMAGILSYFTKEESKPIHILVATSGDTGSAVAAGFHQAEGVQVSILYPAGRISELQEKHLNSFGGNIQTVAVNGSFDDCQNLVRQAFQDPTLKSSLKLCSANSINIARLLPQMFYYWEAYKQLQRERDKLVFIVPSGNFGNLTAGLMAQRMGLPAFHFVAATNANDVVPQYMETGKFTPRKVQATIANAMDVGNPSNFERIQSLYGSTWNIIRQHFDAYRFSEAENRAVMRETYLRYKYVFDPHTALGYLGWRTYQKANLDTLGIILGTAHPAKFKNTVDSILNTNLVLPEALKGLPENPNPTFKIGTEYVELKECLL